MGWSLAPAYPAVCSSGPEGVELTLVAIRLRREARMARLALIADDLTGAADSGVQFSQRGFCTELLLDRGSVSDAEVVIVDTESRAAPPDIARAKVHAAAASLPPVQYLYKKIDSTLRGNLGAELEATMDARHIPRAVVAPAFPAAGRTTVGGHQLLSGRPLEDTAFAHDPLCPIADSYIPALLGRQMRLDVGLIELTLVRRGVEVLAEAMGSRGEAVLVVDAVTDGDLLTIARAAAHAGLGRLTCGSAGMANALVEVMIAEHAGVADLAAPEAILGAAEDAPVLVVAGSRNPLTLRQLSCAAHESGLAVVGVDTEGLAADVSPEIGRLVAQAAVRLSAGDSVALSAVDSPYVEGLSHTLAQALGQMTARLVSGHVVSGLVLTGGDVALAVCRALGATALSLVAEISPGIPIGRIRGGNHDGLPLVTKAGGFGDEEAILTAMRHLRAAIPS